MERSMKTLLMALLLVPALALAQDDAAEAAEPVEEAEAADAAEPADAAEAAEPADAAEAAEPVEEASDDEEAAPRTLVDLFYVPSSTLRLRSGGEVSEEDGDGFGARAFIRRGEAFVVTGEYQTLTLEGDTGSEADLEQLRLGVGLVAESSAGSTGSLIVEYDKLDSTDGLGDLDGFSLHGRVHGPATDAFQMYFDIGYLMLDGREEESTGFEFTVGALVNVGGFGVFADFRRSQLNGDDSGTRWSLADARAGLRLSF